MWVREGEAMSSTFFFGMPVTALFGLASVTLMVIVLVMKVTRSKQRPPFVQWLLIGIAGLLALGPLFDQPLVIYLRGFTGDMSMAAWVFAMTFIIASLRRAPLFNEREVIVFKAIIAILSLFLYPAALGWGAFDPYRLGFDPNAFQWLLIAIALGAWWFNMTLVTFWLALSLLSYNGMIYESLNLWDYLIDPFMGIISLTSVMVFLMKRRASNEGNAIE